MWVFDLGGKCMRWANPAGLAFWNAATLEAFLARDFSNLSPSTITRNQAQMDEHAAGHCGRDQWTVYPLGKPTTLNAHTIGIELPDGSRAILYEASQVPTTLDPSVLRGVEAMQQTPMIVGLFRISDGSAVMRNPSGVHSFGIMDTAVRRDDFAAMFVDPNQAITALGQVRSDQIFTAEAELVTLKGSCWYELDVRPVLDPVTGESMLQFNAQDISARKTYENELKLAQKAAEAANLAKSRFLATMSHEIRTPMNGILGMAQLLLMPNLNEDERRDSARTIHSSGQALLTLLNDILDFSKIEAGKFELESVVFDPVTLLSETEALFLGAAQANHLHLTHQWQASAQNRYNADAHRIRQMISNLAGNAIKFSKQGTIHLFGTEIERDTATALLEFSVTDNGIGIAADKQDLLFKPFSQTESSITREFGGSGLGLSIVSQLARLMGGDVGVQSVVGQGSRFWFRVRVKCFMDGENTRQHERADPTQSGSSITPEQLSGRVLVVEDNLVNRMVIESLLDKLGLTVTLLTDGQQAVDAITQGDVAPDIILMDLHMPVMDGYTAVSHIRHWEAEQNRTGLPIIALTADAFEEDRQHCMAVGMNDFLTKPIDVAALRLALGKWLTAHRNDDRGAFALN